MPQPLQPQGKELSVSLEHKAAWDPDLVKTFLTWEKSLAPSRIEASGSPAHSHSTIL